VVVFAAVSPPHLGDYVTLFLMRFKTNTRVCLSLHTTHIFRGKLHYIDHTRFAELYPRFGDFNAVRRSLDPNGVFENDWSRRVLGD